MPNELAMQVPPLFSKIFRQLVAEAALQGLPPTTSVALCVSGSFRSALLQSPVRLQISVIETKNKAECSEHAFYAEQRREGRST